jgi:hypothetical protein
MHLGKRALAAGNGNRQSPSFFKMLPYRLINDETSYMLAYRIRERRMKLKSIVLMIICGTVLTAALSIATQQADTLDITPNIILNGGSRGRVPFPHQKHIDTLGDCNVCHDLYQTTAGSIDTLKSQGKLEKKYVMNKQCTKCHRARKKTGEPSGPTKCSTCHIR